MIKAVEEGQRLAPSLHMLDLSRSQFNCCISRTVACILGTALIVGGKEITCYSCRVMENGIDVAFASLFLLVAILARI